MKRPDGTYTRLAPLIDEMFISGVPVSMIAAKLELNVRSVSQRVYDKALNIDRDERREQVADALMGKHRELLEPAGLKGEPR